MRIVVISDSHRSTGAIDKILSSQPDARYVFFLGDNASDIEDFRYLYPDKRFYAVCGNCDFASDLKTVGLEVLCGKRIFYTHGHTLSVKYGISRLAELAKSNNYDIVLYGHTHVADILYEDGVYFVNPGSCAQSRSGSNSYAVIDIADSGIMPIIVKL